MIVWQSNPVPILPRVVSVFTSGIKTLSGHWPPMACECSDWLAQKLLIWKCLDGTCALQLAAVPTIPYYHPTHLCYLLGLLQASEFGTPDLDQFLSEQFISVFVLRVFSIVICQSLLETFSHPQPQ